MAAGRPLLCLVTDRRACRGPLAEAVAAAVAGGVDWVQIREKDLSGSALLALCEAIAAAARRVRPEVRVLVNRRCDVALAAALDGVHLGFDAVSPSVARHLLGAERLVGASTHAAGELDGEARAVLSYAQLAPIFAPLSKPAGRAPLGPAVLRSAGGLPVLAQGGVDADNAAECIRAGAAGVAVTGAILLAGAPEAAAAALRRSLDNAARGLVEAGR